MNIFKTLVLAIAFPVLLSVAHKYYVSVTQVQFYKEEKTVRIISKIDIEDLEYTLRQIYDESVILTAIDEKPKVDEYIEKYLRKQLKIKINSKDKVFNYIGKEYENMQIICYLEIENIASINTIGISNKILIDLIPKQKNVIKLQVNAKKNTLIFTEDDSHQLLKYK